MEGVYAIGELSRLTGVQPDTIRAWERRYGLLHPVRTTGNRRRYGTADIARVRMMQRYIAQRVPAARAADLVRQARTAPLNANPGILPQDVRKALTVLHNSLERYDDEPADGLLRRLLAIYPPAVVLRDVVLPYLCEVGKRWECGATTVGQEHFASSFLEAWMLTMSRGWGRHATRRAVLAALPGERHVLGLIAFGLVLRDMGWQVIYLGPDTPIAAAKRAAGATEADAIVLSATRSQAFARRTVDLRALADAHPVAFGGAGTASQVGRDLGDHVLPSDLVAAAHALTQRFGAGARRSKDGAHEERPIVATG